MFERGFVDMKIQKLELKYGLLLDPMAGVTDKVFREICCKMGCEIAFTEMISARGIYYRNKKTLSMLPDKDEKFPVGVQVFGSEERYLCESVKFINEIENVVLIDINMGCPVNKVVKSGSGAALMREPLVAYRLVSSAKKVSEKPVSVKFRKGWDDESVNAVEFAKVMQDAGADMITVHGRTRQQMYSGKSDWEVIKKVKEVVKIPVIGNGDLFSAEDVERMFLETGCDGVMIARGALGNPWIFDQAKSVLMGKRYNVPLPTQRIDFLIEHYKCMLNYHAERFIVKNMRKHLVWYLKGMKNSAKVKAALQREMDINKVVSDLIEYREYLSKENYNENKD